MAAELVVIGRVVKPHGIQGEVAVDVLSDIEGRFDAGCEVVLRGRSATIATSRPHQGRMLVRFEHVGDRNAAERLRGATIEAEPLDLADQETYFAHELVDLPVLLDDERDLGVVVALIELPEAAGYDLLEVRRTDGSSWLLPAVDDYVHVRDDDAGLRLVVVDPPEGLLDGQADDADAGSGG